MSKLSKQEKCDLVKRYQNGERVVDICTKTGVAKSTFYTWIKRYENAPSAIGSTVSQRNIFYMKRRLKKLEDTIRGAQTY